MNNWFNNRNYQISIIQISLTLLAVAKCALYERCTIAMLKHVCDVFKHGQTAVPKSSLYERCTYYSHSQTRVSCTQTGTDSWSQILTVWEMYYSHSQARVSCTQTGTGHSAPNGPLIGGVAAGVSVVVVVVVVVIIVVFALMKRSRFNMFHITVADRSVLIER